MKHNSLNVQICSGISGYGAEESEMVYTGLNLEIQETLAADQVNTFTETLEKVKRIENEKAQIKAFQV